MGLCCSNTELRFSRPIYHSNIDVIIPFHDSITRKTHKKRISCPLSIPVHEYSKFCSFENQEIFITGCVLPGMDPSLCYNKECQDNFLCITSPNSIISVLLDGHGKHGKRVAEHCKRHIEAYCKLKLEKIHQNPKKYVEKIIVKCDKDLKSSKIDTNLSGTTAVVVYLSLNSIHVSSVGDSRAIIGTSPKPKKKLQALPLTVDQKPNNDLELKRITESGGCVQRMIYNNGQNLGPYRVWIKGLTLPGLAMSRSIGDKLAASVGVISTPIIQSFSRHINDKFIVLASDGIWDVMTNEEVVSYLEKFSSQSNRKGLKAEFPITPLNATISRLLCEEARKRWIEISKKENVMIDDISCLVIEIENDQESLIKTLPDKDLEDQKVVDDIESGILSALYLSRNGSSRDASFNKEDGK
ncbi:unnamed protein product [Blepharisma stoltei]|uniref:PPM-type phosphatase domain-containing protein n=1 Tax=Blepharisma stoltei TaxID=1481888 RepID=A0AAU9JF38_9CILI|nr:unnamed protein product [Blepharisma stoltei]